MDSEAGDLADLVASLAARLWDWFGSGVETMGLLASFGILLVSLIVHRHNRRSDKIRAIDANLDVLQRLNENALDSDANLRAAVLSVRRDDEIDEESGRVIFFTYLRINRMLRAFEYWRHGLIGRRERNRIVDSYLGTRKPSERVVAQLLPRGYPVRFQEFLTRRLKTARMPPRLDGADSEGLFQEGGKT